MARASSKTGAYIALNLLIDMKKCRIVKKTYLDGTIKYQIQQKHWLFRWWWCGADHNYEYTNDTFDTLEEAEENSAFFRGLTKTSTSEVVKEY